MNFESSVSVGRQMAVRKPMTTPYLATNVYIGDGLISSREFIGIVIWTHISVVRSDNQTNNWIYNNKTWLGRRRKFYMADVRDKIAGVSLLN